MVKLLCNIKLLCCYFVMWLRSTLDWVSLDSSCSICFPENIEPWMLSMYAMFFVLSRYIESNGPLSVFSGNASVYLHRQTS